MCQRPYSIQKPRNRPAFALAHFFRVSGPSISNPNPVHSFKIYHHTRFDVRTAAPPRTDAAPNQMWTLIRRTAPFVRCKSCYTDHSTTRHFYTRTSNGVPTGLYGFDHLKSPNGFQRFVDDAIERLKKK